MPSRRQLLGEMRQALAGDDRAAALATLSAIPAKTRLGPLFSLLLDKEPLLRWRAVTTFGAAMADIADARLEDARDVWRNLMWRVNEESGNIAWGIPECMGETLARCPVLARDYHRILLSYVQDLPGDCTFIDHPPLRRGAWWAIARLAEAAPQLCKPALPELTTALADCDPAARGLACLAVARIRPQPARGLLEALARLAADAAAFDVYDGWNLAAATVAEVAARALAACRGCL
ncbi:MAG: DVU0298 family protein [Solidesulfovibrio sp.]|uniref:DVU0298 family protein n=1 Tax=Solidesulfovibrio sp. TaxID=2910990 RepID=UPI002B200232|nr:DVU0298 family protein [Solidesulfovibrio sp.]MEA4858546.1 HEAT repeat domain-containing protein [Solidesulfovibrio sp.]